MATYRDIAQQVKQADGFVPKPCWIAHVLSGHGLTRRQAFNRINSDRRTNPCPPQKRAAIERALMRLGIV